MNLKHLDKVWRENCPEESYGLVNKRKKGNRWNKIILSSKAKKKLNKERK